MCNQNNVFFNKYVMVQFWLINERTMARNLDAFNDSSLLAHCEMLPKSEFTLEIEQAMSKGSSH